MIAEKHHGAYSAQVEMRLIINGDSISISQMGPDFLLAEAAKEYPPGDATLILQVDQSERRWVVRLPEGLRPGQKRVPISK